MKFETFVRFKNAMLLTRFIVIVATFILKAHNGFKVHLRYEWFLNHPLRKKKKNM